MVESRRSEEGFTLIELLVVITVLGILVGVVVFAIGGVADRDQGAAPRPTGGVPFAAASNATPPFSFIQPDFQTANAGRVVTFSFGASGTLSTSVNQSSNPTVLFASADEANVNKIIATTDPVAGGSAGTCTGTCLGIGSTKCSTPTGAWSSSPAGPGAPRSSRPPPHRGATLRPAATCRRHRRR